MDTRITQGGSGPLTAAHGKYQIGTSISSIGSPAQNGNPLGCNIPDGIAAIAVSVNMLNTTASGNVSAWSTDVIYQQPAAGTAVYNLSIPFNPMPGEVYYNGGFAIIPVGTLYGDFFLAVANGQLDMTINVLGYWLPFSWSTTHSGWRSVALGNETFATGDNSITMGYLTSAKGYISTAIGYGTTAGGEFSFSAGYYTSADGPDATAMGHQTRAQGIVSTALGYWTTAAGTYSTALGWLSTASGDASIAMGQSTDANGTASSALGEGSTANGEASLATGYYTIATGDFSTATGWQSKATEFASTAMGHYATASGIDSTAIGLETTASGRSSISIGAGARATGDNSTAVGTSNVASGPSSMAMGMHADTNGHLNSFAYGDGSTNTVNDADYQFMVRSLGGFKFLTSTDTISGVMLAPGSSAWTTLSDYRLKDGVEPVDVREVLARVTAIPLSTWHYKTQDARYRHMGPMAQDFYGAFRLGESDTGIDTVDADGVALAAIQGLASMVTEQLARKDQEIASLRNEVAFLQQSITRQSDINSVEALRSELQQMRIRVDALSTTPTPPALNP